MGLVTRMYGALLNATFGLADTNRDATIDQAEAASFARAELSGETPYAAVLGLSGGALPLDDDEALQAAISGIYGACDTDSDGVISRAEAEAVECRRHIFELLRRIPQPEEDPTAAQPAAAGSGGAASTDAKAQQQAAYEQYMQQMMGGASAGDRAPATSRGGGADPLGLTRHLNHLVATWRRNLQQPNLNTYLAAGGVAALGLRQGLAHDVLGLRGYMRPLIGGPLPDFLDRLRNIGLVALAAGAFYKFE
jgi:hypothetical protein